MKKAATFIFFLLIYFSACSQFKLDTLESTLIIRGIENDTIHFTGELISITDGGQTLPSNGQPSRKWPRRRAHVRIYECKNLVITGLVVIGPNIHGGLSDEAYNTELEAQHAIEIEDSENITIKDADLSYIYGDGIYLRRVTGAVIENVFIHNNGRQGIAIIDSKNVVIKNNHFDQIRRTHIDFENNNESEVIGNISIVNNKFGASRLNWISGKGKGWIQNIMIHNNYLYNESFDVYISDARNLNFIDNLSLKNRGTPLTQAMRFFNVDGLYIADNVIPVQPNRGMYLGGCYGCKNVLIGDNLLPAVDRNGKEQESGKNEIIIY